MLLPKFCVLKPVSSSCNVKWWSQAGSNRRPPACKAGALPAELWPHDLFFFPSAALHFVLARSCIVYTLPRSPQMRLADEKKSCVKILSDLNKGSTIFCRSRRSVAKHSLLCERRSNAELRKMVGLGRFELPTSPLSGVRSNQLSYRPKVSHWLDW